MICYCLYFRTLAKRAYSCTYVNIRVIQYFVNNLIQHPGPVERIHFQDIGSTASLWTGRQQVTLAVRSGTTRMRPYTRDSIITLHYIIFVNKHHGTDNVVWRWGSPFSSWSECVEIVCRPAVPKIDCFKSLQCADFRVCDDTFWHERSDIPDLLSELRDRSDLMTSVWGGVSWGWLRSQPRVLKAPRK